MRSLYSWYVYKAKTSEFPKIEVGRYACKEMSSVPRCPPWRNGHKMLAFVSTNCSSTVLFTWDEKIGQKRHCTMDLNIAEWNHGYSDRNNMAETLRGPLKVLHKIYRKSELSTLAGSYDVNWKSKLFLLPSLTRICVSIAFTQEPKAPGAGRVPWEKSIFVLNGSLMQMSICACAVLQNTSLN